jgi:hypothetical protein
MGNDSSTWKFMQLRGVCGEEAQGRSKFRLDSKFSDLNLDLILNLVLLPKNFKLENHENHAPRARDRADQVPEQLYRYDDAAAWHLPAKFMIPIRLYGEIEVITEMELGPAQIYGIWYVSITADPDRTSHLGVYY